MAIIFQNVKLQFPERFIDEYVSRNEKMADLLDKINTVETIFCPKIRTFVYDSTK